ncbi:MAG: hypothetical protein ACOYXY_06360, partial [Thermodesulfobacteriota bacterium]
MRSANGRIRGILLVVAIAALFVAWSTVCPAAMRLKVSHQFAEGDVRDVMAKVFAEKVAQKLGKEVEFRFYPASSLYKAKEQWDAMKQGV